MEKIIGIVIHSSSIVIVSLVCAVGVWVSPVETAGAFALGYWLYEHLVNARSAHHHRVSHSALKGVLFVIERVVTNEKINLLSEDDETTLAQFLNREIKQMNDLGIGGGAFNAEIRIRATTELLNELIGLVVRYGLTGYWLLRLINEYR